MTINPKNVFRPHISELALEKVIKVQRKFVLDRTKAINKMLCDSTVEKIKTVIKTAVRSYEDELYYPEDNEKNIENLETRISELNWVLDNIKILEK